MVEKRNRIIYWVATGLFAFGMLTSGVQQLLHTQEMTELVRALGYPLYFLYILGVWKLLGVIAILIPRYPLLKEWAYAGFFFAMSGALVSHLAMGDTHPKAILGPVMQLIFIITSWYFRPADRKYVQASP